MAKGKGKGKGTKTKGRKISVDFSGAGQKFAVVPEGEYLVQVESIDQKESDEGKPYLVWTLKITEGKFEGKKLRHMTSLQPQALFNLRDTLEALGVDVPASTLDIDLDAIIGLECAVAVEIETYQGRRKSAVVDIFSSAELVDEEEEDDEEDDDDDDTEDEEDDEEDDEEEDYDEMDLDELKALCKERGIKVKKKAKKKDLIALLEEDDDEDDE